MQRRPAIDRLLRGISTDKVETVRDAWRELIGEGASSAQLIQEKLNTSAWLDAPRGPASRYFGVLLALLDEVDPAAFEKEVDRLRASRLHPLHRQTLELMAKRIGEVPAMHLAGGIPVFVSSDIADRATLIAGMQRWSQTRGVSLAHITRIDVIGREQGAGYLGKYNRFFSGIVLTWPSGPSRGIRRWWRRLDGEFTFYHEIGHHTAGHIEAGQVDTQEQEADDYARTMMANARPVLTSVVRALIWPFRPLLRRLAAAGARP
ncbi:hypothetical protein [Pelagovum sp. HNIBRBA483]|uniref:hypothetical protein n=1 Tax=Pelagovum sp. HNIBRBA483 TaxID=3233341 RepID=UPI0034A25430